METKKPYRFSAEIYWLSKEEGCNSTIRAGQAVKLIFGAYECEEGICTDGCTMYFKRDYEPGDFCGDEYLEIAAVSDFEKYLKHNQEFMVDAFGKIIGVGKVIGLRPIDYHESKCFTRLAETYKKKVSLSRLSG